MVGRIEGSMPPERVRLSDVTLNVSKCDPRKDPRSTFCYVDISAIDQTAKRIASPTDLLGGDAPSRARQILKTGDVLVSTVRPNLNAVAHVGPDHGTCIASTGFCVLRPHPSALDDRYLFHWVRTPQFVDDMVQLASGASYPAVSDKIVKNSTIPLPPIEVQQQIATMLDEADALRTKRRDALANLDALTRAIFIDMFGDPRLACGDSLEELGEHVELFSGSTLPEGSEFTGQVDGYALVKVSDLARDGNDKFIVSTREWTPHRGSTAATCPPGSIVIPKRGGAISTNRKRIATRPSILDPNLMGITPDLKSMRLAFLYGWFDLLDLESIQSGSSVPQLNKKDLVPLRIAVPSISEQERYDTVIDGIDKSRSLMAASVVQMEALNSSLQQRAFRGEL